MSLEYVLLTAIALMGSYSWIKSAQRNGYTPLAARSLLIDLFQAA